MSCLFNDRRFEIRAISLNGPGSVLGARLEAEFGERLGPLVMVNHTVIRDHIKVKQHQIGYKPICLTALGPQRKLEEGQQMNVTLNSRGVIV